MKNKLFIDCTQLVHWPGKLTGIPRVMHELALRFASQPNRVFVIWDNDDKNFYAIDLEATLQVRGQKIHYEPSIENSSKQSIGSTLRESGYKMLASSRGYGVPVPGRAIAKLEPKRQNKKTVSFQKGDALFVLWGEQSNLDYIDQLKSIHAQGVKLIQISYDMLPLITPQYSGHSTASMKNYTREIFPLCDLVLAISKNTKKDIIDWLRTQKLKTPEIRVFRLGDDFKLSERVKPAAEAFLKSGLKGNDYILCVGTIEARKNHTLLYYVYKLAKQRGLVLPKLVVVGRRGWKTDDIYELLTNDPDTKDQWVLLTSASDEELSWLYSHCLFSAYPSFYEGWGLPVAESIAHGIPCISSNTSSLPEIAGDLIKYFSPVSSDECLGMMQELLKPSELAKAKEKLTRYTPHTWDQAFRQVERHIKEIQDAKN